jgi:hypothetical protein
MAVYLEQAERGFRVLATVLVDGEVRRRGDGSGCGAHATRDGRHRANGARRSRDLRRLYLLMKAAAE